MLVNNKAKVVLLNKHLTVSIKSLNTHRRGNKQRNFTGVGVVVGVGVCGARVVLPPSEYEIMTAQTPKQFQVLSVQSILPTTNVTVDASGCLFFKENVR
ncbi:hypothetical protein NP493_709g00000 [Ridgeia piscesae]|uniref:Uncharacterized protein n=1 Tax=Ridgeia piscesae TaxID=27915 RepID=A0AAD9KQM5_RIDPI|nr:hypothetical protein NP493_709g00000 [Ridgeia piscesae]